MKTKRLIVLAVAMLVAGAADARVKADTTYWRQSGVMGVNLTQVSLTNWSAGGDASVAFDVNFGYSADYIRANHLWQNRIELSYGLNNTATNGARKTNDKIYLSSMYGYKFSKHWYVSALMTFETQFANGFDYAKTGAQHISRFMAPGYLSLGPGLTWTPNTWFTATFSPVSWRGTFVLDDMLSDAGAFGVDKGKKLRNECGGAINAEVKKEIIKNVSLYSRLNLFSNYLKNPENIDVRWDIQINMKINKWMSTNLNLNMIYDDDIKIAQKDGTAGPRLQFKEVLGVGFNFAF